MKEHSNIDDLKPWRGLRISGSEKADTEIELVDRGRATESWESMLIQMLARKRYARAHEQKRHLSPVRPRAHVFAEVINPPPFQSNLEWAIPVSGTKSKSSSPVAETYAALDCQTEETRTDTENTFVIVLLE